MPAIVLMFVIYLIAVYSLTSNSKAAILWISSTENKIRNNHKHI
uniref:Uncharacterized protein n=1 Tax=Heterorhabditis bacteriophora TaxID=37862 RepID=A0A1I7X4Y6_HETBA